MATENIYGGMFSSYPTGKESDNYGDFNGYRASAHGIGLASDARTAAQLQEVSNKLATGAKVIETGAITPDVFESIPKQHFQELNRLKKLVGIDLTLHGPIVEASGIGNDGWSEQKMKQAERQMLNAVERAHDLNPKGNTIVTFHTTAGLPEMKTRVPDKNAPGGEKVTEMFVIDERDGSLQNIRPKRDYLLNKEPSVEDELKKLNDQAWYSQLANANYHGHQAEAILENSMRKINQESENSEDKNAILKAFKNFSSPEGQDFINDIKDPATRKVAQEAIGGLSYGKVFMQDAYNSIQNLFAKAWMSAEKDGNKEELARLKAYRDETIKKTGLFSDSEKLPEFAEHVMKGVNLLSSMSSRPEVFQPLQKFAINKSSETFSELALDSYKKFKEHSPIISLENPPAGGGISRAEDMKILIEQSRNKFVEKAVKGNLMDESDARREAEKIIGATWDVGHINMIRKFGYGEKDLKKEVEKIAPFVKHVHLSDNFGMEHTELPMGMGNVPTKDHLEAIDKYNKQVKKIIEAGNWYQHFKTTPYTETLSSFGSPLYSMKMAPYWNQQTGSSGGYFAGYGMNPDIHHSIYGSGFSTLPVELGGQMAGKSRIGGAPIE